MVTKDINSRIRALLDFRSCWSDLITRYVINIPNAVVTGGVTTTSGSTAISGTATNWPLSDLVNTTLTVANRQIGYQEVTPASMTGISVDTNIWVSDSTFSEVVSVVETSPTTFTAQFQYQHNNGVTITASSLAGRQFQFGPLTPIYTLLAVSGASGTNNTGVLDMQWGGQSLANSGYQLVRAYIAIPNFRSWAQVWDPTQGIPLATNVSQSEIDAIDAQRTSQGWPQCLADLSPSASGSWNVELWPWQTTTYAIPTLYNRQWPTLSKPTDRLPPFINPSVVTDGAIADALRRKDLRDNLPGDSDPYFNPALAREYDAKFEAGAIAAANADEERCVQRLTSSFWQPGGNAMPGASYWQSHVNDGGW